MVHLSVSPSETLNITWKKPSPQTLLVIELPDLYCPEGLINSCAYIFTSEHADLSVPFNSSPTHFLLFQSVTGSPTSRWPISNAVGASATSTCGTANRWPRRDVSSLWQKCPSAFNSDWSKTNCCRESVRRNYCPHGGSRH